jgi:hypothetical protein
MRSLIKKQTSGIKQYRFNVRKQLEALFPAEAEPRDWILVLPTLK